MNKFRKSNYGTRFIVYFCTSVLLCVLLSALSAQLFGFLLGGDSLWSTLLGFTTGALGTKSYMDWLYKYFWL